MSVAIRCFIGLTTGLVAIVAGWFAALQIMEVQRVKREATRVTGWLTNWGKEGGFRAEVALQPEAPEQRTWVAMSHDTGVRLFSDVDVYLHPTDPAKSRLGGLLQFWLSPALLAVTAILFLLPAVWTLTLSEPAPYEDPLPAGWVGRWVWFARGPWPEGTDDLILRLPSYYWIATLLLALIGAPVLYRVLAHREAFWHGRLLGGIFGLLVTAGFCAISLHFATYKLVANDRSAREASVFGWRQAPWSSVRRLEDESVRRTRWSSFSRRYEPGLTDPGRRSLVLVNDTGKKLMSMGIDLEPPSTRRKVWELAQRKTGLKPVDTERRVAQ
jgi:hypothetical protein